MLTNCAPDITTTSIVYNDDSSYNIQGYQCQLFQYVPANSGFGTTSSGDDVKLSITSELDSNGDFNSMSFGFEDGSLSGTIYGPSTGPRYKIFVKTQDFSIVISPELIKVTNSTNSYTLDLSSIDSSVVPYTTLPVLPVSCGNYGTDECTINTFICYTQYQDTCKAVSMPLNTTCYDPTIIAIRNVLNVFVQHDTRTQSIITFANSTYNGNLTSISTFSNLASLLLESANTISNSDGSATFPVAAAAYFLVNSVLCGSNPGGKDYLSTCTCNSMVQCNLLTSQQQLPPPNTLFQVAPPPSIPITYAHYNTSGNYSCYDGVQNGNETGIDCGGSCIFSCDELVPCTYPSNPPSLTYYPYNADTNYPVMEILFTNMCGLFQLVPQSAYNDVYLSKSFQINLYGSYNNLTSMQYSIPQPGCSSTEWDLDVSPASIIVRANGSQIYPYASTSSKRKLLLYDHNVTQIHSLHNDVSRLLLQDGYCISKEECHEHCDIIKTGVQVQCVGFIIAIGSATANPLTAAIAAIAAEAACQYALNKFDNKCSSACDNLHCNTQVCVPSGRPCGSGPCCNSPPASCEKSTQYPQGLCEGGG